MKGYLFEAEPFYKGMYDYAKSIDDTRPFTRTNCMMWGRCSLQYFDLLVLIGIMVGMTK